MYVLSVCLMYLCLYFYVWEYMHATANVWRSENSLWNVGVSPCLLLCICVSLCVCTPWDTHLDICPIQYNKRQICTERKKGTQREINHKPSHQTAWLIPQYIPFSFLLRIRWKIPIFNSLLWHKCNPIIFFLSWILYCPQIITHSSWAQPEHYYCLSFFQLILNLE